MIFYMGLNVDLFCMERSEFGYVFENYYFSFFVESADFILRT